MPTPARARRWIAALEAVWRDLLYGLRLLRRSPGFAAVAVLVLALGIGVTTAIFSVINAVLVRPLPVRGPDELAFIYSASEGRPMIGSYGDYLQLAANTELFSGVTTAREDWSKMRRGPDVELVAGESVSANYFEVLGVTPKIGRALVPSLDEAPGSNPVVVISESLWRRHFNSDPLAVGRTLVLTERVIDRSRPYTVVGIMPSEFSGVWSPWTPTEYWIPMQQRIAENRIGLQLRTYPVPLAIGRLQPNVTLDRVQAFATAWGQAIDSAARPGQPQTWAARVVLDSRRVRLPFSANPVTTPSRLSAGLIAVSGLVLLIGVANLAGIMMARGVVRRSELAIRLTLGASRWRVARQLLTEGVTIAALGGALGLVVSRAFVTLLLDNMPAGVGVVAGSARRAAFSVPLDFNVILFTILVCTGVALAVGLAPIREASRKDLLAGLAGVSAVATNRVRSRLRYWIVVPQVCVSLALLLAAGVAVRGLLRVALVPPGYDSERTALVEPDLPSTAGPPFAEDKDAFRAWRQAYLRRLLEVVEAQPEIEAAAFTNALPLRRSNSAVVTRDAYLTGAGPQFYASARVTPGYFRTLNIPLLLGRGFDSLDASGKSKVAIVDETLGARLWPGESPIGRYLALNLGGPPGTSKNVPDWLEVIGVVGAVKEPLSEGDATPFLYTPNPALDPFGSFIVVRSRVGSSQLLQTLRDAVGRVDERVGVLQVRTLTSAIDDVRYPRRIAASLLGFSGLIGLVLAAIGLYGVVSYSVAQRLKELGIRAALGADRADIARLVVKEGVTTAAVGAGLGLIAAFILIRIASNQVMPMPIPDLTTLIVAPVLLGAVVLIACYIPARRAARVDPMVVLRGL